jgi:hypothetical protein
MARPYGGRPTCETCQWIDVRRWRREGRLNPGETFPWSWTIGGKPYGTINVQIEPNAVLLRFRARSYESAEWKLVEQHCRSFGPRAIWRWPPQVPLHCVREWPVLRTPRGKKLYLGGSTVFACRHCYGLTEAPYIRRLSEQWPEKFKQIKKRGRTTAPPNGATAYRRSNPRGVQRRKSLV